MANRPKRATVVGIGFVVLLFLVVTAYLRRGPTAVSSETRRIRQLEENVVDFLEFFNQRLPLRNDATLPPLESDYVPIVLYVYKRADILQRTVAHLRNATGIERTVLIVSHDGFVPDVARVVDGIDFVRVVQIVHPTPPKVKTDVFSLKAHWWCEPPAVGLVIVVRFSR
jgi:hypothetical protein